MCLKLIDHLVLEKDEYALMDMKAGIEHFGRGTDNGMDLILMIVDPSYESLALSKKILEAGLAGKELKMEEESIQKMTEHILKMSL